jgi:glutamyl-tRNA synthetase
MTGPLPVGRLAPSPSGRLHVGHARTFLLAWWHVRARGGRVLLRLEDLDRVRVKPGASAECLADLEWLGLDWDEGPWLQSEHTGFFEEALEKLLARGLAYHCACSRAEIARAQSAPHASDGELRYPGHCRELGLAPAEGSAALAVRLRVPAGKVRLHDGFQGPFEHDVQAEVGDFLLARRDGFFAYQLAVVVDDARTGVTEVLRGDDLLPSATRQWHLQRALDLASPAWFHVPLVLDERGERLAKRRADLALADLRARGVDPRALVGWVARSAGFPRTERLHPSEFVTEFDLARVPRTPVTFGEADLAELQQAR